MNSQLIQSLSNQLASAFSDKVINRQEPYDSLHQRKYSLDELPIFVGDLITKVREYDLTLISSHTPADQLAILVEESDYPILYFEKNGTSAMPVLAGKKLDGTPLGIVFDQEGEPREESVRVKDPYLWESTSEKSKNGQALYLTAFPMESLVSQDIQGSAEPLTPVQRLLRLLGNEKKDIGYIYLYAIVIGLITLSLPLGVQAIINLISGGMVFSSVYLLLFVVIGGVFVSGIMQIIQFTLVETLQQRIFAKAAFEFTYRIPRVKAESLLGYYPPELMNRFFDVLTVQKALPKILIDLTGAILQILLGIMLLSFYHPFFIAFGFLTFIIIALMIYFNGPKGLQTSLVESKYKYKVAQWLEDIARSLYTFKLAGTSNLPMEKMDGLVNNYLLYRKKHFKILKIFFWNAVGFKTLVIGGLLILGTILVVEREISLGQFVATEIIIVLLTSSVEKLIQSIDTVFDSLTAVEKLGHVTDMPLEREHGFRFSPAEYAQGLHLHVTDLKYHYPDKNKSALNGVSFNLQPRESICITGPNASGKNTLFKVLTGLLQDYEGGISFNGISLRDLNVVNLRSYIEQNSHVDDIFEGSILQNITMGRNSIQMNDLEWALDTLNLTETISQLPEGLGTQMLPGGQRFSESFITKINLARCIITRPKILLINDELKHLAYQDRLRLTQVLTSKEQSWALIILSNEQTMMQRCDRVMVLKEGRIVADEPFDVLKDRPEFEFMTEQVPA